MALEIERKFLVSTLPPDLPSPVRICQGYILNHPERVVRIRTFGQDAVITIKAATEGLARLEYEYPIPLSDAREMLGTLCPDPPIDKERFTLDVNGMTWEIDRFLGENLGLVVAEIELEREGQAFDLPPWAGREVTHDPRYINANLIKRPYSAWTDRSAD